MPIPVLMYHAIGDAATGTQEYDDGNFTVTEAQFREHLQLLRDGGYKPLRFDEINASSFSEKAVVITFDDGHASDADIALPILQEFGFVAEFFITTSWVGSPGYMNEAAIKLLGDAGMGLGGHGHSHRFFNDMDYAEALEELSQSRNTLQAITDTAVLSFSAPGGQLPKQLGKLSDELELRYVCTSSAGTATAVNFPMAIPRIAMRKDLAIADFEKIVSCDTAFYRRIKVRAAVLGAIRKTIGNDTYMGLREKFLAH